MLQGDDGSLSPKAPIIQGFRGFGFRVHGETF